MRENETARLARLLHEERTLWAQGVLRIAGVDEVGRGPLAGPVIAAAVMLPEDAHLPGIDDSKRLSARRREQLAEEIARQATSFALGVCEPDEIDRLNILRATHEAMRRALAGLDPRAEHALVDGLPVPALGIAHTALIGGDGRSQSIAAASIIAKVERDRRMRDLAQVHPGYGFERHVGYPTPQHLAALGTLGPCEIHRRSFAPVRRALQKEPHVT
ncbi:MAG: ribonuclease HII [Myxococcota bacterium]